MNRKQGPQPSFSGLHKSGSKRKSSVRFKCALDLPEYKDAIYEVVRNISGGYWAASINCHTYNLYTLWNVNQHVVRVIYFNFSNSLNQKLPELHAISNEHLDTLKIKPVVTLQDGERDHSFTSLPLSHFAGYHMWQYLTSISVITSTVYSTYSAAALQDALDISSLQPLLNTARSAFRLDRTTFTLDTVTSIFNEDNARNLVEILEQITVSQPPLQSFMTNIISAALDAGRLLFARKFATTDLELNELSSDTLHHLEIVRQLFHSTTHAVCTKPQKIYFEEAVIAYQTLLKQYPHVPYEVLLFCFDYHVSNIRTTCRTVKHHYLVDMLPYGQTFERGTFTNWCGDTPKKVLIMPIPCTGAALAILASIIDSGDKQQRH